MIFRWILREWKNNFRFSLLFILTLSIGMVGYLSLEILRSSLSLQLNEKSKNFLAADISLSAKRPITTSEKDFLIQNLPEQSLSTEFVEFYSMASAKKMSKLVQIKAIEQDYPFYGFLNLQSGRKIESQSLKEILDSNKAWVSPEILSRFNLQIGDSLFIGDIPYTVADVVKEDSTQTFKISSLSPKIYIGLKPIKNSPFLQKGSTTQYAILFKIQKAVDIKKLTSELNLKFSDPALKIENSYNAAEDSGRLISYVSDYLGLVSLIAYVLALLGGIFLFRSFLKSKIKEMAILRTLGLQESQTLRLYLWYIISLSIVATLLSLMLTPLILKILIYLIKDFLPVQIDLIFLSVTSFINIVLLVIGSYLFCWPIIMNLKKVKITLLLREDLQLEKVSSPLIQLKNKMLYYLPSFFFLMALIFWEAKSFKVSGFFILGMTLGFLLLAMIGFISLSILEKWIKPSSWPLQHSFKYLYRNPLTTLTLFVVIGLGTLLITLLPQIKTGIKSEFSLDPQNRRPSLFLFDIQKEQLFQMTDFLHKNQLQLESIYPLIRARLISINNTKYEKINDQEGFKTREAENEARFRNRSFNLTFKSELGEFDTLKEGKVFRKEKLPSDDIAEISVEDKFAERLGIHLNDTLEFDIQGVEQKGRVVNLRKVKWTSFRPNFFVIFEPGFLEEAPTNYLAVLPKLTSMQKEQTLNSLNKFFPNVSAIDISQLLNSFLELIDKVSHILEVMALLTLMAGFSVLFSLVSFQAKERKWDLNMLKILGASPKKVHYFFLSEFLTIGFFSSLTGSFLSIGFSYILSHFVFNGVFEIDWPLLFFPVLLITAASVLIAFVSARNVLNQSPKEFLK